MPRSKTGIEIVFIYLHAALVLHEFTQRVVEEDYPPPARCPCTGDPQAGLKGSAHAGEIAHESSLPHLKRYLFPSSPASSSRQLSPPSTFHWARTPTVLVPKGSINVTSLCKAASSKLHLWGRKSESRALEATSGLGTAWGCAFATINRLKFKAHQLNSTHLRRGDCKINNSTRSLENVACPGVLFCHDSLAGHGMQRFKGATSKICLWPFTA